MMAGPLDVAEVERRVIRACKTVRALPDPDRRFLNGGNPVGQRWQVVQEYIDAYGADDIKPRFQPTQEDLTDCLLALSWCRVLDKGSFKFIWWRSFDLSFGLIAARIGRSDETARNKYKEAINRVWRTAAARAFEEAV